MNFNLIYEEFQKQFDLVGIIATKTYLETAKKLNINVPNENYETMVVVGLSYPYRQIKATEDYLIPSFYTFGKDYHFILKERINKVMNNLSLNYIANVDNHKHNERLASNLAGIGYMGKNQLIISKEYGSYIFLGIIFIDLKFEKPYTLDIVDDCGDCTLCIKACPTGALDNGYDKFKCISYFNQEKLEFDDFHINKNHSLFGCDICQVVCPKNINKGIKIHNEFILSNKEKVSITDLLTLSSKEFIDKYADMAYLWRGKTVLMRNAIQLINRKNYAQYLPLIKLTLKKDLPKYYTNLAKKTIEKLENSV